MKATICIYAYPAADGTFSPILNDGKLGAPFIFVSEKEIEFDFPSHEELVAPCIDLLREEQKGIQAEATMKITVIDRKINNMLSLSFEPATEVLFKDDDDIPF